MILLTLLVNKALDINMFYIVVSFCITVFAVYYLLKDSVTRAVMQYFNKCVDDIDFAVQDFDNARSELRTVIDKNDDVDRDILSIHEKYESLINHENASHAEIISKLEALMEQRKKNYTGLLSEEMEREYKLSLFQIFQKRVVQNLSDKNLSTNKIIRLLQDT